MIANVKSSPTLIPAIYKHGVFAPVAPLPDLFDDQFVQLQIWSEVEEDLDDTVDENQSWADSKDDAEWAALPPWEQQGRHNPLLSPQDTAASLQWVHAQWASLALPSDQALEIATADWLVEENLWL